MHKMNLAIPRLGFIIVLTLWRANGAETNSTTSPLTEGHPTKSELITNLTITGVNATLLNQTGLEKSPPVKQAEFRSGSTYHIIDDISIPQKALQPDSDELLKLKAKQGEINSINNFANKIFQQILKYPALSSNESLSNKTTQEAGKMTTLIWSPYSVYQSLVPLLFASGGKTHEELYSLLLQHHQEDFKNGSKLINMPALNFSSSTKMFSSVTGLFTREDIPLNVNYIRDLQRDVTNVEIKQADFNNASGTVKSINTWVRDSTEGLITEPVLSEGQIDPSMFLMIVNCVRFKAPWKTPFDNKLTETYNFNGISGMQSVQMMVQRSTLRYAQFPIGSYINGAAEDKPVPFSILEMPYDGSDFVSMFILPNATKDIPKILEHVGSVGIGNIRKMLGPAEVEVSIPRFSLSSDVHVVDALIENGLKTIFNPSQANLTKLLPPHVATNNGNLTKSDLKSKTVIPAPYISKIIHRTIFEISEEGTKAGAVTTLSIVPLSGLMDYHIIRFTVDRPFIVMLVKENTIVFQGVIYDLIGQELTLKEISKVPVQVTQNRTLVSTSSPTSAIPGPEMQDDSSDRVNLKGDQPKDVSPEEIGLTSPVQTQQVEQSKEVKDQEEAWWIPQKIPEYLYKVKSKNTTEVGSVPQLQLQLDDSYNSKNNSSLEAVPEVAASSTAPVSNSISFTKYQQPEPKDPHGIRFPVTIPQTKLKSAVKPRYEDSKNSLLRWMMNVY